MALKYESAQESQELLLKFLLSESPSGYEYGATRLFEDTVKSFCDEMHHDAIGNVTAILNPEAEARIIISAHADQTGFQITAVTDEGMLRFRLVGGLDPVSICGHKVRLLSTNGSVEGVIARNRAWANMDRNGNAVAKASDMWIDIGAKNREDALQKITVGDLGVFSPDVSFLNENVISAPALDNKVGLFVIAEVLRLMSAQKLGIGIYVAATVQEEIGLRGMAVVAQAVKPRIGLVVDMAHATDIPGGDAAHSGELSLGRGLAFTRNADNSPKLVSVLRQVADAVGVPYQISVGKSITGGTDASRLQLWGGNALVANVSVPCRNMHSPAECCDLRDIASTVEFIVSFLSVIGSGSFDEYLHA